MGRGEVGLGVQAEDGMLEIVVHTGTGVSW